MGPARYELAVAKEAAGHFELPELPQVIFWAMVLNEAERLGVLRGRTFRMMELALTKLRWNIFESWVFKTWFWEKAEPKEESSRARQQEEDSEAEKEDESLATEGATSPSDNDKHEKRCTTGEKRQRELGTSPSPFIMAFPALHDIREMADFVMESFIGRWRRATCLPYSLPEDYQDLRLRFSFPEVEGPVLDFGLPEMVQATFYATLRNDAIELGVMSGFITDDLKSTLVGLTWTCFEAWMSRTSHELREAQLRSKFQAAGATWRGQWLTKREKSRGAGERMEMILFPNFADTDQAADYVQDNFRWALRERSAPGLRPLSSDYRGLCPCFDLGVATRYAHDSHIPEMV
ncbi:hypothetical protein Cgig2_032193 [Carnegiea gigantea]|uniref:Uncharacterized protein n=1 Tax=Carnegiea gigantea TaxID=171969 RepID=A0A9Q1K4A3_9CARY|nr:hypothetical protein Cgig2_032193 [Carnegiea gigantea]